METRLPPPTGPPPSYQRAITKVYPYSLRPVMLSITFLAGIWSLVLGYDNIRDLSDDNSTSKMHVFEIVTAALFFGVTAIALYAIATAILQKLKLARLFAILAPLGAALAVGAELVNVIAHYMTKSDVINACTVDNTGIEVSDSYGNISQWTSDDAKAYCTALWGNGTWRVFVWFFAVIFIAFLWLSVTLAYYRQLLDPASVRTRANTNQSQPQQYAYPLQPQHSYGGGDYAGVGHQGYVPPYPGPPAADSPFAPKNGDADAKELSGEDTSYAAQERAWTQAQRAGTSYAPPPGPPPARYVTPNEEEDVAWEHARSTGVTAHLTGDNNRQNEARV